MYTLWCYSYNT